MRRFLHVLYEVFDIIWFLVRKLWRRLRRGGVVVLRLARLRPPVREPGIAPREVVLLGGYGYGNTGDEAQLGANLTRWRAVRPPAEPLVLSPHPDYTAAHHGCRSAAASRSVLFGSNETADYGSSSTWFRVTFWFVLLRMELNAHLMAAGLAPLLASGAEARLLLSLQSAAVVHVSGGGFMTGPTRSRLWDTCLVLRLCRRLGTPYFLTGQTLGIFQNAADRWLARTALRGAAGISLRDPAESAREVAAIGVPSALVSSTVDDALFCETAAREAVDAVLAASGVAPGRGYLAVNYHWWGMDADTRAASAARLAETLDGLSAAQGWQVVFVPMVPGDVEPQRDVMARMIGPAVLLDYDYDYRMSRGAIAGAAALISFKHHPLIFAMGEAVPCLSVSFDAYYHRKNRGAMANLGQERYCVDRDGFFGAGLERLFGDLASDRARISADLTSRLTGARGAQDAFFAGAVRAAGVKIDDPA